MNQRYPLQTTNQVMPFLNGANYVNTGVSGSNQFFPKRTALDNPDLVWHETLDARVSKPGKADYHLRIRVQREYPDESKHSNEITGSSLMITQGRRDVAFLASGTLAGYKKNPIAIEDPDVAGLVAKLISDYENWPKE